MPRSTASAGRSTRPRSGASRRPCPSIASSPGTRASGTVPSSPAGWASTTTDRRGSGALSAWPSSQRAWRPPRGTATRRGARHGRPIRRRSRRGRSLAGVRASRAPGPVAGVTADAVRVSSPGCDPAVGADPLVVEPASSDARLEWTAPDEAVLVEGATRTRVRFVRAGGHQELLVDGWRPTRRRVGAAICPP